MSGQIFISYRREDSSAWARLLNDRLFQRFPNNHIFIDVDLDPGIDFVQAIEASVGSCDLLIAVIGKRWLRSSVGKGKRRLENPEDFVRVEIATALNRNIRVIPVLVDGASMPRSSNLPDDLKLLVRLNALEVSHNRFNADSGRLLEAVEKALEKAKAERKQSEEKPTQTTERHAEDALNRGFANYDRNEYDKAISDYNEALRLNPYYPDAFLYRGITFSSKNEYDKAISDYNMAILLEPDFAAPTSIGEPLTPIRRSTTKRSAIAQWRLS